MQEIMPNPEPQESKLKASPLTIGLGLLVTVAILGSLWFLFEPLQRWKGESVRETVNLKLNPLEQEYSKEIEIEKIELSRAENFLHQEVTILSGEVHNGGAQPVRGLSLTAEFFDSMNQIVLRETRRVVGTPGKPLAPGERREFEISFEHIPNTWNRQPPSVRIAYLQLPPRTP
jgi:hypothetical protein